MRDYNCEPFHAARDGDMVSIHFSKKNERLTNVLRIARAQNGKLAVEAVAAHPDSYDVIFMDIMMPVMDGLEAAKAIRQDVKSRIPMFAMTANAFTDDIKRSLDAGMDEHLTKPLQEKNIVEALLKYLK